MPGRLWVSQYFSNMPSDDSSLEQSRRLVYFAAERTLTSWIRTALSLMALGFVIDRFDLVLRTMFGTDAQTAMPRTLWWLTGAIMIALGVAMSVVSGVYYLRYAQRYRRDGSTQVGRSLTVGAVFTVALGLFGLVVLGVVVVTLV
jgi:inner membrane protein YidH